MRVEEIDQEEFFRSQHDGNGTQENIQVTIEHINEWQDGDCTIANLAPFNPNQNHLSGLNEVQN